ncbi:MAG TPA: hypothetical protein IAC64_10250 [Candidatus Caccomorpha excrementavium]|nr:hypothetical protein [Candidatus Caccomorpha excrementavium]
MIDRIYNLAEEFWLDEEGIGVVEIILILVVLIGLVVIFQAQIEAVVTEAFERIMGDAGTIID